MIRVRDVYDILGLPSGLRTHMARTAAVVELVSRGAAPQLASVISEVALAMALHDVGNAVKPVGDGTFLGEPPESLGRWSLYSAYTRARYGSDEHAAASAMLGDLGVRPGLIALIERKSSSNLASILEEGDPGELLAIYADMRVAPSGLVSISERHEDAEQRYARISRRGLGGDVGLAQLEELQDRVQRRFNFDPGSLTADGVDERLASCLAMDLSDAFE